MDEYKWNNDDFQNNSQSGTDNFENATDADNFENVSYTDGFESSSGNDFFEEQITQDEKSDKKIRINKMTVVSAVLAVCLIATISVSGYLLKSGVPSKNGNMSQSLVDNLNDGEDENTQKEGVVTLGTVDGITAYSTPEVVDMVGPAVVGVINKAAYTNPFSYYYGYQPDGEIEQGSGSGVIISDDGYIVTNNHVIEGATEITVILNAGEEYSAKLIGQDSRTDLAVLKIEAEGLAYAKFGISSDLRVGETAIAIGNPLGQEFAGTTTQGIISGLNRSITIDNKTMNLIQTDAAINPGNSGGALCNDKGLVVGINTAKISSSKYEGLGFAIPIDDAKPIIEDLILNGYVTGRPVIGIAGRAVTEQDAKAYNLKVGVYVSSMTADSPADMAGIKIGDIIYECDGVKVETVDDINEIKNKHKVGDTLKMKVYRQGKTQEIKLVLGEETPYVG